MLSRLLLCALLPVLALSGCDDKEAKLKKTAEAKAESKPTIKDVSNDTSFQAFVGHLRAAVSKRDKAEIATLMSPYFGYSFDQDDTQLTRPDTVFALWDQHNLWPELSRLLASRFVPSEEWMVAPLEFAAARDTYRGHRVGIRLVNGSWKFDYFVTGEDVLPE
jgi:hypothetical protein